MKLRDFGYTAVIAVASAALLIGSAATGEAKSKKKTAAPPPPVICTMEYKPVCAVKGGMKFTYSNACFAAKDGAKVVSQGPCKAPKAMKAMKAGGKKKAAKAKAKPEKKK